MENIDVFRFTLLLKEDRQNESGLWSLTYEGKEMIVKHQWVALLAHSFHDVLEKIDENQIDVIERRSPYYLLGTK